MVPCEPGSWNAFVIERRTRRAVGLLVARSGLAPRDLTALVVCCGAGMEGRTLLRLGFKEVTVSDVDTGRADGAPADAGIRVMRLNAESMGLPDNSFDVVLVQDGLHHLRRPAQGLVEMLRVARKAVVVMEPHSGLVARLLGKRQEFEGPGGAPSNFVFRWERDMFRQLVSSYLVGVPHDLVFVRFWSHNPTTWRLGRLLGEGRIAIGGMRMAFGFLDSLFRFLGNQMIGIVIMRKGG